jgi:hypothetical protein
MLGENKAGYCCCFSFDVFVAEYFFFFFYMELDMCVQYVARCWGCEARFMPFRVEFWGDGGCLDVFLYM